MRFSQAVGFRIASNQQRCNVDVEFFTQPLDNLEPVSRSRQAVVRYDQIRKAVNSDPLPTVERSSTE